MKGPCRSSGFTRETTCNKAANECCDDATRDEPAGRADRERSRGRIVSGRWIDHRSTYPGAKEVQKKLDDKREHHSGKNSAP
ncbi:hypothetical protein D3C71_1181060 [compost metagenome]